MLIAWISVGFISVLVAGLVAAYMPLNTHDASHTSSSAPDVIAGVLAGLCGGNNIPECPVRAHACMGRCDGRGVHLGRFCRTNSCVGGGALGRSNVVTFRGHSDAW